MSNLNNEMEKEEQKLSKVLEKYDEDLKQRMKELITHSYFDAMTEIERRGLIKRGNLAQPRIDYFLQSMLHFVFDKLHKGDRLKAYELLKDLQDKVISI